MSERNVEEGSRHSPTVRREHRSSTAPEANGMPRWSNRGLDDHPDFEQSPMDTGIEVMGGTGLEPVRPTYDIGRQSPPRAAKTLPGAGFFRRAWRLLSHPVATCRNGRERAPWSRRGPDGRRASSEWAPQPLGARGTSGVGVGERAVTGSALVIGVIPCAGRRAPGSYR